MSVHLRKYLDLFLAAIVLLVGLLGAFQPLDKVLRDWRYELFSKPVSGDVVFLAIDPKSIESIGVWPWPRQIHAEIIDKLIDLDAADIVFDIDFSSASNPVDDALLEQALERAGGFVSLAAFNQPASFGSSELTSNLPIERFRAHSDVAVVNVMRNYDGHITSYPYGVTIDGTLYPSIATLLNGRAAKDSEFLIDFSIDVREIDVISIKDLLAGKVDPVRVADKQVVVGASALELRDNFVVSRFGLLPGPLLQVLATETVQQDRKLLDLRVEFSIFSVFLVAIAFLLARRWSNLATAIGIGFVVCVLNEALAAYLFAGHNVLADTVSGYVLLAIFVAAGLYQDLGFGRFLLFTTEQERDATKGILDRVIADNFDGVVVVDSCGKLLTASRFAQNMLGFTADQIADGVDATKVLPARLAVEIGVALEVPDDTISSPEAAEMQIVDASGEPRLIEYVITLSGIEPSENNAAEATDRTVGCLTFRDVTERRANEERLRFLATRDPLTNALSRSRLVELIDQAMSDEIGKTFGVTLFLLNLSRFKAVNDMLGHSYGDRLLQQVVDRLRSCDVDAVARLGGDSFAVTRAGVLSGDELSFFCDTILEVIAEPFDLGDHKAIVGVRIGATTSDISGFDPERLISNADMAVSVAKKRIGSAYACYAKEMDDRIAEQQGMEIALRQAIENDELYLVYQPQVCLENRTINGVEALVRWRHPERGAISPAVFIPVAEETGLILELGRWALATACKEVASWPSKVKLAVNVSPMQFEYSDVVADVEAALDGADLPAARLDVEVTEGVLISNPELVTGTLKRLKALGVGVALDDFGTGYSSLSYLGQLPIDKIKIDQTFVRALPEDKHSAAVVNAVVTLSESLGKTIVAEGIETLQQVEHLSQAGCHIGQGYYYGRPVPGEEIAHKLACFDHAAQEWVAA